MRYVLIVLVAVLLVVLVEAGAFAGWSGSDSGSSGSGKNADGQQVQTQQRDVAVGKYVVKLPQSEVEVLRVDGETVIYPYGGQQLISTAWIDLLNASGVVLPADGVFGEWETSYGSNGNSVVYQARHSKVGGVFVRGSVTDLNNLKAVLATIRVVEQPTTKPAAKPVK